VTTPHTLCNKCGGLNGSNGVTAFIRSPQIYLSVSSDSYRRSAAECRHEFGHSCTEFFGAGGVERYLVDHLRWCAVDVSASIHPSAHHAQSHLTFVPFRQVHYRNPSFLSQSMPRNRIFVMKKYTITLTMTPNSLTIMTTITCGMSTMKGRRC
jgi:hypothetical protein